MRIGVTFAVSSSISQAFADDALRRDFGPHIVVDAVGHAIVVTEIELREIAMQMLFTAMLVDAFHAPLE
jgi:hypothetical protein